MRNKKTEKIFVEVKVPIRSCVVCRGKAPKEELKKIPTDKQGGKGAYVHKGCIDAIKTKKVLHKIYKSNISDEIYDKIIEELRFD